MSSSQIDQIIESSDMKYDIIQNLKASEEFKFLNAGNDRVVAKPTTKSVVYKIEDSPNQNVKEFEVYNRNDQPTQYRLLDVIGRADNYKWIKCSLSSFDVSEEDKIRFVNLLIDGYNIIPKDFCSKDIGRVNGNIVITDYGYGFEERKEKIDRLSDIKR